MQTFDVFEENAIPCAQRCREKGLERLVYVFQIGLCANLVAAARRLMGEEKETVTSLKYFALGILQKLAHGLKRSTTRQGDVVTKALYRMHFLA